MAEDIINEAVEELDEAEEVVVLTDDDGEGVECEYLDTIEYEGAEYVVLLPYTEGDEEEGAELLILKVETLEELDEDGEPMEQYVSVDSEELLDTLFGMFQEAHADEFEFTTGE